ncbi:ABC transporter permease [Anaeromyxobacter diazotrophicus]|uniref:ABC transporter permease n=1 Tax=Anaeromyxobacter diazotrophicus TaxID=2590199 RepID=UPI001F3EBFC6|nr:ABC transporter permease [Anaeromyxobacter diazotrophicus]
MTTLARPLGELWKFRELIALLVSRDLKVRYKRSVLGMGWTLLSPLLQMLVYTLVFKTIMRVDVPQFPVFLLAGFLPWTLISVSLTGAAHCLLNNQGLIRKVAVPQMVYPLAVVASKLVDLLLSLVPLAIIAAALGRPPGLSWLGLFPSLVLVTLFSSGLALLFSSLTVFYRDMRHLIDILIQVWFYVTPVIYPVSYLEKLPYRSLRWILAANPATPIVRCFQLSLYEGRLPGASVLGPAALATALVLGLGVLVFTSREAEHIHHF